MKTQSLLSVFIRNAIWQFIAKFSSRLLAFLVIVQLVRYLGDDAFGRYAYVITFVSFFTMFTDLGLNSLLVKEISKFRTRLGEFIGGALMIEAVLSLIVLITIQGTAHLLQPIAAVRLLIIIAAHGLVTRTFVTTFINALSAYEEMHWTAWLEMFDGVLNIGLVTLAIFCQWRIGTILALTVIRNVLMLAIFLLLYYRKGHQIVFKLELRPLRTLIAASIPFVFYGLFYYIYNYIDVIMLEKMSNFAELGQYGTAYRMVTFVFTLGGVMTTVVFPQLSLRSDALDDTFYRIFFFSIKWLMLTSVLLVVIMFVCSEPLTLILFGSEYIRSGQILNVLIFSVFFNYCYIVPASTLVVRGNMKGLLITLCFSIVTNICLNFWLIPIWGGVGAALATVITELATLIGINQVIKRTINIKHLIPFEVWLKALIFFCVAICVSKLINDAYWPITVAGIFIIAIGYSFITGLIGAEEKEYFKRVIRWK